MNSSKTKGFILDGFPLRPVWGWAAGPLLADFCISKLDI
jgi:hypothetical protein